MVSSSTSPKFIPELLLWPLEILIKVKFVLSSFDSTADMARVAFPPVKRHPRYAGSYKVMMKHIFCGNDDMDTVFVHWSN